MIAQWRIVVRIAVIFYLAAVVVLHLVQPELPPFVMPMSAYVNGNGGWLMRLTFLALSIALFFTATGLWRNNSKGILYYAGILFLVLGSIATIVAGIFPADMQVPPNLPVTRAAWIHLYAGMVAFPSFLIGSVLLTIALSKMKDWKPLFPLLWWIALSVMLCSIWFMVFAANQGLAGLAQRILFAILFSWLWVVSSEVNNPPAIT